MLLRLSFAACLLAATPALADEAFCLLPRSRMIDPNSTQALRELLDTADPGAMRAMSGTWYGEIASPDTAQISYLWQRFEPNGLYSYRNRVCDRATNYCADYKGTGLYGLRSFDGAVQGVLMVSDLERDHVCSVLSGRITETAFIPTAGPPLQRVGP